MRNVQSSVEKELHQLQKCLPHFTIRMINKLEGLVEEGILSAEEFNEWVDPDMYAEISKIIQQVVTTFKLTICSDKTMNKVINSALDRASQSSGGLVGGTSSTSATSDASKKDSSEKIVTYVDYEFDDDMTGFQLKQINRDIWIKESIMIALKSIVRHMKQGMGQEDILVTLSQLKQIFKSFYFDT